MIRVSNSLDPDQFGHFVGPDLGPNCLQSLSADNTTCTRGLGFEPHRRLCVVSLSKTHISPCLVLFQHRKSRTDKT